jgi:hypothetical protein
MVPPVGWPCFARDKPWWRSQRLAVFEDIGSSGLPVARRYCPRCGSPLTTEPDVAPEVMMVKTGGIDSNEWFHPVMECSSAAAVHG